MKKQLFILLISMSILVATLLVIKPEITGEAIALSEYSYTRAICDESNYCQDYEIDCDYEEIIKITPITGASVQHSLDWKDPREKIDMENLCKDYYFGFK